MNASFEMRCKGCSADLEDKYYYQNRLTEEKICGNCAVIEMSWSVETLENKIFIHSKDAMLIAPKGYNVNNPLKGFISLQRCRASRHINTRLVQLVKDSSMEDHHQEQPLRKCVMQY